METGEAILRTTQAFSDEVETLAGLLLQPFTSAGTANAEALLILASEKAMASSLEHYPTNIKRRLLGA